MARTLWVCALILIVPLGLRGEETNVTIKRVTVSPRAAPKPVLRHQLLPELMEMNPGNPIHGYLKCYSEQTNFFFQKESSDNREKWGSMPLKELPLEELKNYGGGALRQADYAARLDNPDWGILLKLKTDGYRLLLPDVQQMRTLTAAMKVRMRAEVAGGRFDDAIVSAKTMYAMSRHMGEHPTLIGNLVGVAMAQITNGVVEEMIQQPGSPNLFWALADLPSPFIDMRRGAQGERAFLNVEFAMLDEKAPMSDSDIEKVVKRFVELSKELSRATDTKDDRGLLEKHAKDEAFVRDARKVLIDAGLDADAVKKFPPMQVVLLEEKHQYEAGRDDGMKGFSLPYWQYESIERPLAEKKREDRLIDTRYQFAHGKVRRANARLEQMLGLLRHVEAVRLYAAAHDGKVPAKLEDLKLPLPVDPFTGKPFIYRVEGDRAIIQGSPPKGEEKTAHYNIRLEVTIRK